MRVRVFVASLSGVIVRLSKSLYTGREGYG